MKRNYQAKLDCEIEKIQKSGCVPTLLLHSCCAPCSSYVLEYLSKIFSITVYYYNPNIYPSDEYFFRQKEQQEFIQNFMKNNRNVFPITFVEGPYEKEVFYEMARGLEQEKERGRRCMKCYELRLRKTAEFAKQKGFDYFTTTLSISPLKDAQKLNDIGERISKEFGVAYLFSDFKKKNGYLRSIQLSADYGMYRQKYCGCIYSLQQKEETERK